MAGTDRTPWHQLPLEELLNDPGLGALGPPNPTLLVASAANALSSAMSEALSIDVNVPDRGAGTYLGVCLGVKPSGGHSIRIESAELRESQVMVRVGVRALSTDDVALQAVTSPFAAGVVPNVDPRGREFFVPGSPLWEVIGVGG